MVSFVINLTLTIAGGFVALAFFFLLYYSNATKQEVNTLGYGGIYAGTVLFYYVFFCLFMIGVAIRQKHIMQYCGFLNSVFMKSLFYVFLASLAFADLRCWEMDVIGGVFGGMAILSWVTYCGKDKAKA